MISMKRISLNNTAVQLLQMGDIRGALSKFREALPCQCFGVSCCCPWVLEGQQLEQNQGAEGWMSLFCEPVRIALNVEDDRVVQACILFNLAILNVRLCRNEEAIKFFEMALSVSAQIPSMPDKCAAFCGPHPNIILGHIQFRHGCILFSRGQFEEALRKFEEAYEIRKRYVGNNGDVDGAHHSDVAAAIYAAAICNQKIDNDMTALYLFMDFIETATLRVGEGHFYVAASCMLVGDIHIYRHELISALEYYLKAFNSLKQCAGIDQREIIKVLVKIGGAYFKLCDYDNALKSYTEKLVIERAIYPDNSPNIIATLIEIARLYQLQENYDQAYIYYQEALILQYSIGEDDLKVAFTLTNIGCIQCRKGHFEYALAFYGEALRLRESNLGQVHFDISTILNSIGTIHFRLGRNVLALTNYQRSLQICRSLQRPPRDIAAILSNISAVHAKIGDEDAALAFQMEILDLERSSNANSDCVQDLGSMFHTSVADPNLNCAPAA